MTQNISSFGLISRHAEVYIDFSCYYNQPEIKSFTFKIRQRCVSHRYYSMQLTERHLVLFADCNQV